MADTQRKYVGARYVPLIMGEWDITATYEPLSVVLHEGNSYTSRSFVPAGVSIDNDVYWALSCNYSAAMDGYVKSYDTVTDMQDDTTLDIGTICRTLGYNEAGDGNAAWYKVEASGDIELNNGLYAKYYVGEITSLSGFFAVSTDKANENRPAYGMYTDDFSSLHYVDLFIPEYFGLDKRTPVDSSCLAKIGDYYYYAPNSNYAYSKDFENWTYASLPGLLDNNLYESGEVWVPNGIAQVNDKIYWYGSLQYKAGTLADYGLVDAFGESGTAIKKACYIEVVQNQNGSFSLAQNAEWIPFSCIDSDNVDYIDPYLIYSNVLDRYILAVKNELTKKIEIYDGSSISNLQRVNLNDNLYGVEGAKLFEDNKCVYIVATVHNLCGYNSKKAGCVKDTNSAMCCVVARLTHQLGIDYGARIRWNIIKTPINVRHLAIIKCDEKITEYINKNGYDSFVGYRYNGQYDNLRVGFDSPVTAIDDTVAYGNFYINIINAPGINYSLEGSGQYTNAQTVVKDIPINSLLAFVDEDNDNYLISRTNSTTNYKFGNGFLGTLSGQKPTNPGSGLVFGKFTNFNNSQCAYISISGLQ